MKQRLQTSLGQQLVLTPQLMQALHLLQLSTLELEAEISEAVESNPLLEWDEEPPLSISGPAAPDDAPADAVEPATAGDWDSAESWQAAGRADAEDGDWDATTRLTDTETLRKHLAWQLHLT